MSSSVNIMIIVGRLGQKPELRYTPSGAAVANMSVATTEIRSGRDKKKEEITTWIPVVVWGNTAENCAKYLDKGSMVSVEGSIRGRSYEKNGETRRALELIADRVHFLDQKPKQATSAADLTDDIPF